MLHTIWDGAIVLGFVVAVFIATDMWKFMDDQDRRYYRMRWGRSPSTWKKSKKRWEK